jgi:hypothetical protein
MGEQQRHAVMIRSELSIQHGLRNSQIDDDIGVHLAFNTMIAIPDEILPDPTFPHLAYDIPPLLRAEGALSFLSSQVDDCV